MQPATRLEWRGVTKGPVAWSIGVAHEEITVDDHSVWLADCRLVVRFFNNGVELAARIGDNSESRRIAFSR
jgi:hypothetical protein